MDFRRQSRVHTTITIDKTPVERVNSFKFLGVHITEDLTWSAHTDAVLKKAHQRLFKVQGSLLFVTYTIIQGIISSEMQVELPWGVQCENRKSTSAQKHIHHKNTTLQQGKKSSSSKQPSGPSATIPALVTDPLVRLAVQSDGGEGSGEGR